MAETVRAARHTAPSDRRGTREVPADLLGRQPDVETRWHGALHPWIEPPDVDLLALAPAEWWPAHRALPVGLDSFGLLVAAPSPLDCEAVDELQGHARHPVEVVRAAAEEVTFWLDV